MYMFYSGEKLLLSQEQIFLSRVVSIEKVVFKYLCVYSFKSKIIYVYTEVLKAPIFGYPTL